MVVTILSHNRPAAKHREAIDEPPALGYNGLDGERTDRRRLLFQSNDPRHSCVTLTTKETRR